MMTVLVHNLHWVAQVWVNPEVAVNQKWLGEQLREELTPHREEDEKG